MFNYPRHAVAQYPAVPPYRPLVFPRQLLGVAAVGVAVGLTALSASRDTTATAFVSPTVLPQSAIAPPPLPPAATPPVVSIKGALADDQRPSPYLFSGEAGVTLDFAPRSTTDRLPVQIIRGATKSIKVQSYDLTAQPIKDAVHAALAKRVSVEIMVDQPMYVASKPMMEAYKRAGARILTNPRSGHAHDKTIIADDTRVLLGSINYSRGRRDSDLANTVLIDNPDLTRIYLDHWARHAANSAAK